MRELKKHLNNYSLVKKYAEKWIKSLSSISGENNLERHKLTDSINKIKEEENRYSKAYGSGTLDFEKFQELMKDARKRKLIYNKQLESLSVESAEITIEIEVEELVEEAKKIISILDFSDKFKVIRDIIDKVIVSERSGAEVWIHLPLPATITEKLGYEPERRDSGVTECGEVNAV